MPIWYVGCELIGSVNPKVLTCYVVTCYLQVKVSLEIHFASPSKRKKQIKFDFDLEVDSTEKVAAEMVQSLNLPDSPEKRTQADLQIALERAVSERRAMYEEAKSKGLSLGPWVNPELLV